MRRIIHCPLCKNTFGVEIKKNRNGYIEACECGECEASIEIEIDRGILKIIDFSEAVFLGVERV